MRRGPRGKPSGSSRTAMVLLVVLVVISLLSLAGLTFSELMTAERQAAELAGRGAQARALAESGQEAARLFLGSDQQSQIDAGGWYDNPDLFQGVLVIDDEYPGKRGRFTVVAPQFENGLPSGIRYGLEDASTRLNLNALLGADENSENGARDILMHLPGMNEQIADSILDWMDSDNDPREFGVEVDYYSSLDPPYAPKNGPLDSIEELLLVQGVTPWLLFGTDANRNGYADSGEPDPQSIEDVDNSDGSMNGGWAAYLTLDSGETHLRPDGTPKIDLNQGDLEQLYDELVEVFDPDWATYIVAYRQNGPSQNASSKTGGQPPTAGRIDLSVKPKQDIATVLDLIGQLVQATFQGSKNQIILPSPFANDPAAMGSYLPELMDNVHGTDFPGRININQASRTVLEAIPGMTSDLVDQILSRRQEDPIAAESDPLLSDEAWPLLEGIVTLDEMKQMMPYVCTGGSIYRAQIIGYFEQGGPAARIEVVIDATKSPPAVVSWRDISHLGRGYPREMLGVESTGL